MNSVGIFVTHMTAHCCYNEQYFVARSCFLILSTFPAKPFIRWIRFHEINCLWLATNISNFKVQLTYRVIGWIYNITFIRLLNNMFRMSQNFMHFSCFSFYFQEKYLQTQTDLENIRMRIDSEFILVKINRFSKRRYLCFF